MKDQDKGAVRKALGITLVIAIPAGLLFLYTLYAQFVVDVPEKHIAVLVKKTGKDLENDAEIAPDATYKGLQREILTEGRYFRNPWDYSWEVYPMVEIPEGKLGVRVRLYGDPLPYGHFVASKETEQGIVEDVLRAGRYAINAIVKDQSGQILTPRSKNDYVEIVQLYEPVTISAGFKGVVTNLAGPIPDDPNALLVAKGRRGVQTETFDPGTYYINPYCMRVEAIDCRSQRFNLAEHKDMGFASKDGFWVALDGVIEFRVKPEQAAEVYVVYNEAENDVGDSHVINEEIVAKIILPNARSFCRLQGSNSSGRDLIGGETRTAFQKSFQTALQHACEKQGIEIVQALITRIHPPQQIAGPVRDREVARQELRQYEEQKLQQEQEAKLAIEKAMIGQKTALVDADQQVVQMVVKAEESQQVAVVKANELLEVARRDLDAARDQAAAILARKKAEADVIAFENQAAAAGWKRSAEALGNGDALAKYTLYQRLAPGFRSIMTNTANSPLMEVFKSLSAPSPASAEAAPTEEIANEN